MSKQHLTTIHVYPAPHTGKAVIIRRGPSKWWHFLLWDMDHGMVQPGSWFHGMVYPVRCDFSPRGDAFLMVAYKGTNNPVAWTVISRPPSVRADVFWPQDTAALGGGIFDPRLPIAWINLKAERNPVEIREKTPYEFGYLDEEHKGYGGLDERLARDGWKHIQTTIADSLGGTFEEGDEEPSSPVLQWTINIPKSHKTLILEYPGELPETGPAAPPTGEPPTPRYFLKTRDSDPLPLGDVSWAGWNRKGQLCLVEGTGLYTRDLNDPEKPAVLVMDLGGLAPPRDRVLRETK